MTLSNRLSEEDNEATQPVERLILVPSGFGYCWLRVAAQPYLPNDVTTQHQIVVALLPIVVLLNNLRYSTMVPRTVDLQVNDSFIIMLFVS